MRSLFFKVFIWFWLTTALVVLVHFTVWEVVRSREQLPPFHYATNNVIAVYLETAVEIYSRDGQERLADYCNRVEQKVRWRVFIFDENLNEITGRNSSQITENITEQAKQSLNNSAPIWSFKDRKMLTAQFTKYKDNKGYVFVAELQPSHFPPFINPKAQALRMLLIILTAGILCYLLARYITSPIARLREVTQKFANGDLTARVGNKIGKRRDEIGELGQDFDNMAERIQSQVEAQRQLLSDISHELNSPLARLNVALEIARRQAGSSAINAHDRIAQESAIMDEMIAQLLDISRWENDESEVHKTPVDLARLADEVREDGDFEAKAKNRNVKLIQCDECVLTGSEKLLHSAFENVVRNAVRYTAENTTVEVSLSLDAEKKSVLFKVRDYGEGVADENLEEIFRPFYRTASARDRQTGGAGLGLAITERAVRLHNGTAKARNAEGGGLIVEISLPL